MIEKLDIFMKRETKTNCDEKPTDSFTANILATHNTQHLHFFFTFQCSHSNDYIDA